MAQGIVAMIGRAGALVLIAPVIVLALDAAVRGDWGLSVTFAGVAALMFGLGEIITRPSDLPGELVDRVVGAIVKKD
ncbi:DUF7533 family protein [Halococcoides cellulosivorans]|uniref:Uncharacterized protein n=1 Tax=Halococcoides cellulosivorans TaxID=1679096 RepID=A0A2R4X369_9EURY|nr:hypothetical protein [Halococcoides cellulosivorans]AWB28245.1 hypothetical protein HARCEL1_11300 [Halococcoides cellulosivorans]